MIFSLAGVIIDRGCPAMKMRALAKVNLHLRILGRRADGFHDIETLMVPVSLGDELVVETSLGRTVKVECDHPDVPKGADNLVARAARQFSEDTGRHFAVRILLEKKIPMGAGLGGGSSDAAAVLLALDALFETHLGPDQLEAMAAKLGSDVPFFIRQKPAVCRGRGEIIEPVPFAEKLPLLLIKPPFGVETPWAYKSWAASQSLPGSYEKEQKLAEWRIFNDLERPVFEKFPVLAVMKKWLQEQGTVQVAAMSGSGSTMFAILKDASAGPALEKKVKTVFGPTLWTALCHT
jgi:4-diphosphocytidyl-2-C-methyl-D-erythritol kinase